MPHRVRARTAAGAATLAFLVTGLLVAAVVLPGAGPPPEAAPTRVGAAHLPDAATRDPGRLLPARGDQRPPRTPNPVQVTRPPASTPSTPRPKVVALNRYRFNGDGEIWTNTGQPPAPYQFRRTIGYLLAAPGPGLIPLTSCAGVPGGDHFLLQRPTCDGHQQLGTLGYIYQQGAATGRLPLYACYTGADHFVSEYSNCEGFTFLSILGFGVPAPTR